MRKRNFPTRLDPINLPRQLRSGLEQAERLLSANKADQALQLLVELDEKYPRNPDVIGLLANANLDLHLVAGYLAAMYKLHKLTPNRADVSLGLAGAYLANERMALALTAFRRFQKKWPLDERMPDIQKTIALLEGGLEGILSGFGLTLENGLDFACRHEEMQVLMALGEIEQGKRLGKAILKEFPNFTAPMNNQCQILWLEGEISEAIAMGRKVLALEPENVHALSNLTRYLFMMGAKEAAQEFSARLKDSTAPAWDVWKKKIEALSFIGDDDGVLSLLEQARKTGEMDDDAMMWHQCAIAYYRKSDIPQARRHWNKCLKIDPTFSLARANLDELAKPLYERVCPQAFQLVYWISRKTIDKLIIKIEQATKKGGDEGVQRTVCDFIDAYPELANLQESALSSGEREARKFALNLADMSGHPRLLAGLEAFTLSQVGPDSLRLEASQILSRHGYFKPGIMVKLWLEGKWQEIMMLGFQINYDAAPSPFRPANQRQYELAAEAIRSSDGAKAEGLLRKLLEIYPNQPSVLNNLARSLELQGRTDESDAVLERLTREFPDYFFGQVVVTRKALLANDLELAKTTLDKMMENQNLHVTEFSALVGCQVDYLIQNAQTDSAISWYRLWEKAYPEDPNLERYKGKMDLLDLLSPLLNRKFGRRKNTKRKPASQG